MNSLKTFSEVSFLSAIRRKIENWAGEDRIMHMIVKSGYEIYAEELIRFMYTKEMPFSEGESQLGFPILEGWTTNACND